MSRTKTPHIPSPTRFHIDIETLSTEPDAAIISIGAVLFSPGRHDPSGHASWNVNFADALRHGRADGDTVAWWFKQPEATRLATLDNPVSLENALTQLHDWIQTATASIEPGHPVEYMANGPAFDFVALRNAYQRVLGKPTPWKYWAERDYRTERDQLKRLLAHLALDTSEPERIDAHNALSDAMHQGTVIATLENRLFAGQSLLTSFWRTETDYQTALKRHTLGAVEHMTPSLVDSLTHRPD